MGSRRKARELAIKVLFHLEFSPEEPGDVFQRICENFGSSQAIKPFARMLVLGIWANRESLDGLIRGASNNWRVERMSIIDRNILRLGTYELLYVSEVPPKVSIDEAVELGKRYGISDSPAFVNGVLDKIFNNMKKDNIARKGDSGHNSKGDDQS